MKSWKIEIWLDTDNDTTVSDISDAIESADVIRDGQYAVNEVLFG